MEFVGTESFGAIRNTSPDNTHLNVIATPPRNLVPEELESFTRSPKQNPDEK